jgi:hypothetical protein
MLGGMSLIYNINCSIPSVESFNVEPTQLMNQTLKILMKFGEIVDPI